jgi:hypothetical protein
MLAAMIRHTALKQIAVPILGRLPVNGQLGKAVQWVKFSRWAAKLDGNLRKRAEPRTAYYNRIVGSEHLSGAPITYLEFGVYEGTSLLWWVDHVNDPGARFVGFDTFTGLPEQWNESAEAGAYSASGNRPHTDDTRVSFQVGLFKDTLPGFVAHQFHRSERVVVHLDADLYGSTLFALTFYCSMNSWNRATSSAPSAISWKFSNSTIA